MIYLLDHLDLELFDLPKDEYTLFWTWETNEERVKRWLENERSKTIVQKQEIVNLFDIKQKIQMGTVAKIHPKLFDRIIIFTETGRFFVLEITKQKEKNDNQAIPPTREVSDCL